MHAPGQTEGRHCCTSISQANCQFSRSVACSAMKLVRIQCVTHNASAPQNLGRAHNTTVVHDSTTTRTTQHRRAVNRAMVHTTPPSSSPHPGRVKHARGNECSHAMVVLPSAKNAEQHGPCLSVTHRNRWCAEELLSAPSGCMAETQSEQKLWRSDTPCSNRRAGGESGDHGLCAEP